MMSREGTSSLRGVLHILAFLIVLIHIIRPVNAQAEAQDPPGNGEDTGSTPAQAPVSETTPETPQVIPNSYLVVLKSHVTPESVAAHHEWVNTLHRSSQLDQTEAGTQDGQQDLVWYDRPQPQPQQPTLQGIAHTFNIAGGLIGYSGEFRSDVIERIKSHPDVDYVENDSVTHADAITMETDSVWDLARISHRPQLNSSTKSNYSYCTIAGEGVDVYVIDSGINIDHVEFEGRAFVGTTPIQGVSDLPFGDHGHGTHVAGSVASKKYGVAKRAHVYSVRVTTDEGGGSISATIAGIDWVAKTHTAKVTAARQRTGSKGFKGSVINISMGCAPPSLTADKVINAAVENAGIHVTVSAGNANIDACQKSYATAENAIKVGAIDERDTEASFSNYGRCVDILAPGTNIKSTWVGSKDAIKISGGTSMASPHVAGLLAYLLSLQPLDASGYLVNHISPKQLKADLLAIATKDVLKLKDQTRTNDNMSPNLLAWNGGGSCNYTEIVENGHNDFVPRELFPSTNVLAEDAADELTIKCSVECPYANGQTYDSPSGESFHMDCGARHGTKVMYKDHKDSFKDCMDSCASLLPCHSVDYHASTGTCYYGKHHGEPGIKAPAFASAHTMGCGGACPPANQLQVQA